MIYLFRVGTGCDKCFFCGIKRWWCVVFCPFARCFMSMVVYIVVRLGFMFCSAMMSGFVLMFVVYYYSVIDCDLFL